MMLKWAAFLRQVAERLTQLRKSATTAFVQDSPNRVFNLVLLSVALFGCVCAVYLSLRSTGDISGIPWIPAAIGKWADHHGRIRNLPAYFLLASPFLLLLRLPQSRAWATVVLGVFGTILELAEYFIPNRMVEWQDIVWTWIGVASALVLFECLRLVIERYRSNISCHQPS